ncbi:unnamed protein product [Blepharisma stoltei]|uniref:Uncharacterized protein n=1 Tax=Blepharisma stoltei TaxID=1481888 RepID=A0AAU9IIL1_9CILI|nr:unnamed protein product [Blepharisma stoltei]
MINNLKSLQSIFGYDMSAKPQYWIVKNKICILLKPQILKIFSRFFSENNKSSYFYKNIAILVVIARVRTLPLGW